MLGMGAPNLSSWVVWRTTADWQAEHERWQGGTCQPGFTSTFGRTGRPAGQDGGSGRVHSGPHRSHAERLEELVGFQIGGRESAQVWRELLVDVTRRGLAVAPEIAVGDGALGFWKAVDCGATIKVRLALPRLKRCQRLTPLPHRIVP